MYGSTFIGVVGLPYPYCSIVMFCAFAWLCLCGFGAFGAFGACKIFSKKKNKEFKTTLITSFTLLLSLIRKMSCFYREQVSKAQKCKALIKNTKTYKSLYTKTKNLAQVPQFQFIVLYLNYCRHKISTLEAQLCLKVLNLA